MKLIEAEEITDSNLTSTNVIENDQPEWSPAVDYIIGDKCIVLATHKIYEALSTSTDKYPPDNLTGETPAWIDIGTTNARKMFNQSYYDQTVGVGSIQVEMDLGRTNSIGLMNVEAAGINVKMNFGDVEVYNKDIDMRMRSVNNLYEYFYNTITKKTESVVTNMPIGFKTEAVLTEMPISGGTTLTITIHDGTTINYGALVTTEVGTGEANHDIELGAPFAGGDNGGMVIGKYLNGLSGMIQSSVVGDYQTLRTYNGGDLKYYTDAAAFTNTGIITGVAQAFNPAGEISRVVAFHTTDKDNIDGVDWQYNPVTGFIMCKYLGESEIKVLEPPIGMELVEGWFKVLTKERSWRVYSKKTGPNNRLLLDQPAPADPSNTWNYTEPTGESITLGADTGVNEINNDFVMYGWVGEDISNNTQPDTYGMPGVSAFGGFTADSGNQVEFKTGIDKIDVIKIKCSSSTGDWELLTAIRGWNKKTILNDADIESEITTVSVDGGIITLTYPGTEEYIISAWGHNLGTGEVKCGLCIPGFATKLGESLWGAQAGVDNYSRKEKDIFGGYDIFERNYSKTLSDSIFMPNEDTGYIEKLIQPYYTKPALWVASEKYEATAIYGFYESFNIVLADPAGAQCSITIEGLV